MGWRSRAATSPSRGGPSPAERPALRREDEQRVRQALDDRLVGAAEAADQLALVGQGAGEAGDALGDLGHGGQQRRAVGRDEAAIGGGGAAQRLGQAGEVADPELGHGQRPEGAAAQGEQAGAGGQLALRQQQEQRQQGNGADQPGGGEDAAGRRTGGHGGLERAPIRRNRLIGAICSAERQARAGSVSHRERKPR
jgi:hypothetical protein